MCGACVWVTTSATPNAIPTTAPPAEPFLTKPIWHHHPLRELSTCLASAAPSKFGESVSACWSATRAFVGSPALA